MKVALIPVTPFQQNCSLLIDEASNKAAIVDPGGDLDEILDAVKRSGAELEKIFLTHGHIDHCGAAAELRRRTGMPIEGPQRADAFWIAQLAAQGERFGFEGAEPFEPDRWLEQGDVLFAGSIGRTDFPRGDDVSFIPGHGPMSTFGRERESNPYVSDRALGNAMRPPTA